MKRLQSNLAYLAAIADRSHKPSSQIPAHPAMMLPPPIKLRATSSIPTSSPSSEDKEEAADAKKSETNAERIESLKDYYKQLQALFPGVDPNKEPPIPQPNPAARMQAQQMGAQQQIAGQQNPQAGKQPQMPGQTQGPDLNPQQQKMQQEMLRQKMMQQQHTQNQIAQGMQGMNSQPSQNR